MGLDVPKDCDPLLKSSRLDEILRTELALSRRCNTVMNAVILWVLIHTLPGADSYPQGTWPTQEMCLQQAQDLGGAQAGYTCKPQAVPM